MKFEISKAVIERGGQFLLLKRAPHSHGYPDMWDFAGGRLDPGETPPQALIREVREETSFEVESGEQIRQEHFHDQEFDLTFYYFRPTIRAGELQLSHDHTEAIWAREEDLGQLALHPSVRLFFGLK